jgi:hypothetical protein
MVVVNMLEVISVKYKNKNMKTRIIKLLTLSVLLAMLTGCASIPPEFLTSMEKERDGINLLKDRHRQSVYELTENWYNERLGRLLFIKQLEIDKISMSVDNPDGTGKIDVIKKEKLVQIDKQFSQAITMTNKIRNLLIDGYTDSGNWEKLVKLNSINLEMTRSLTDLNAAQRKFYSELVGKNVPYPSDFINEQTKNLLKN